MKASSEIIKQYKKIENPEEDKLKWLETQCEQYKNDMPNDRTGQSTLYLLLGDSYSQTGMYAQAYEAFCMAKEILEAKVKLIKKVGCGCQDIDKDMTDTKEYALAVEKIEILQRDLQNMRSLQKHDDLRAKHT